MKIALVGSSGYIAGFILKRFSEEAKINSVLKLDRDEKSDVYLDIAEAEKFDYNFLNDIDYVVFTAAISSPDQCAKEYDSCWKINVT